jgi:hypothetical protein
MQKNIKNPKLKKICSTCSNEFFTGIKKKKYCSKKCRIEKYNSILACSRFKEKGISSGTVGAIGEILVSGELMMKGYEIYRALSPSSGCDILAIKNDKILKIEVRTGYKTIGNKIAYFEKKTKGEQFAVILYEKDNYKIHYFPEL